MFILNRAIDILDIEDAWFTLIRLFTCRAPFIGRFREYIGKAERYKYAKNVNVPSHNLQITIKNTFCQ